MPMSGPTGEHPDDQSWRTDLPPSAQDDERRLLPRTVPPMPDAVRLLEELPSHRIAEEIVARAEEAAGCRVALYVVDIGGSVLRLVAGSRLLPTEMSIPQVLGPQLSRGRMEHLHDSIARSYPGAAAFPLWLHGRAVAVLVTERRPAEALEPLARQAAAAVELADNYTDTFRRARRSRPTTAAAEIQENLLPPRLADLDGAEIAAAIVPAYEVGGDWYDYAQNDDGLWFAVADAVGKGPRAAALSTIALGALRAARAAGGSLEDAARLMDEAVAEIGDRVLFVTAVLAHLQPETRVVRWLRFGHPVPLLLDGDGGVHALDAAGSLPLGVREPGDTPPAVEMVLRRDDRLVVTSDGVPERRRSDRTLFGLHGICRALRGLPNGSAAAAATALVTAVMEASPEPPRDDATVLVVAPTPTPAARS